MIPLLEKARQMELTASEQLLLDYIIEDPKRLYSSKFERNL